MPQRKDYCLTREEISHVLLTLLTSSVSKGSPYCYTSVLFLFFLPNLCRRPLKKMIDSTDLHYNSDLIWYVLNLIGYFCVNDVNSVFKILRFYGILKCRFVLSKSVPINYKQYRFQNLRNDGQMTVNLFKAFIFA